MKHNKTRKKINYLLSNKDIVYALLGILATLILLSIYFAAEGIVKGSEIFELKTFVSIIMAFALNSVVVIIAKCFRKKIEDENKLEVDYDRLRKNYRRCDTYIVSDNSRAAKRNIEVGTEFTYCSPSSGNSYVLPVFDRMLLTGKRFVIEDSTSMYQPNSYCEDNMKALSQVHEFSNKYNRTNIRVDGIEDRGDSVVMRTSRTKYFFSLMTNRAIDYKIDGVSYRELFEEGPFIHGLDESTLSNHLGYNGYIETSDGFFVFILRHGKVSIGKNTLQNSVGASLKTEFALDDGKRLSISGIENAIKKEIIDEVHLSRVADFKKRKDEIFADFSFEKSVLFFYRDLVEGGKPQFMFYTKLAVTSEELKKAFTEGIKHDRKKHDRFGLVYAVDGYKMLMVARDRMSDIFAAPDCFVIDGRPYRAMPSAVATFQMMKDYLEKE